MAVRAVLPLSPTLPRLDLVDRFQLLNFLQSFFHGPAGDKFYAIPLNESALDDEIPHCLDIFGLDDGKRPMVGRNKGARQVLYARLLRWWPGPLRSK